MNSAVRSPSDFWAGLIYIGFGLFIVFLARDYGAGNSLRMGPGYFPILLGGMLALIGAASLIRAFFKHREGEEAITINLRSLLLITVPIVIFATIVRGAGVIVALPVLIFGTAYASSHFSVKRTLFLAIGLTVFCSLVFIKGLGIPMPLIGNWFGG